MTVGEIMTRQVVTVGMDDTVETVQALYNRQGFHHLLVAEERVLVGVISDRDLLRNVSPFVGKAFTERSQDRALLNRRVHQIMTRKPVTTTEATAVPAAARLMLERKVSCLPVVNERGVPVGVVTWKDLLRALLPCEESS